MHHPGREHQTVAVHFYEAPRRVSQFIDIRTIDEYTDPLIRFEQSDEDVS